MTLAVEIDQYLAELRAVLQDVGEQRLAGALESTGGVAAYRRQVDPFVNPSVMPVVRGLSPDDLQPFLNGYNPYGPDTR